MKSRFPMLLTGLLGALMIAQAFTPSPQMGRLELFLSESASIVISFALVLGILNLLNVNWKKIAARSRGWGYSAVVLLSFLATIGAGFSGYGEMDGLIRRIPLENPELPGILARFELPQVAPDLKTEQASFVVKLISKSFDPAFKLDEESAARLGLQSGRIEEYFAGRTDGKKFDALFSPVGISFETFSTLRAAVDSRLEPLLRIVVPYGRALEEMGDKVRTGLMKNRLWTDEVLQSRRLGRPIPEPVFKRIIDEIRPLISPGEIYIDGRTMPLGTVLGERATIEVMNLIAANLDRDLATALERDPAKVPDENDLEAASTSKSIPLDLVRNKNAGRELAKFAAQNVELEGTDEAARISQFSAFYVKPRLHLGPLEEGSALNDIFKSVYDPLSATMFALLAFYIASAAFRAFRARSRNSVVLLGSAVIVMLGMIPVGNYLTAPLPPGMQMSDLAGWILNVPGMAAQRAIMIGAALGVAAMALKVIFGVERGHLGDGHE